MFPVNHAPNTKDIEDYIGNDFFDFYNSYLIYLRNKYNLAYIRFKYKLAETLSRRSLKNKDKRKREQETLNNILLSGEIDTAKFNKFKWAKPVARLQIKNLYMSDAKQ